MSHATNKETNLNTQTNFLMPIVHSKDPKKGCIPAKSAQEIKAINLHSTFTNSSAYY